VALVALVAFGGVDYISIYSLIENGGPYLFQLIKTI
jgi:hypothetical protein